MNKCVKFWLWSCWVSELFNGWNLRLFVWFVSYLSLTSWSTAVRIRNRWRSWKRRWWTWRWWTGSYISIRCHRTGSHSYGNLSRRGRSDASIVAVEIVSWRDAIRNVDVEDCSNGTGLRDELSPSTQVVSLAVGSVLVLLVFDALRYVLTGSCRWKTTVLL